jgi:FkbM family methyltransferase
MRFSWLFKFLPVEQHREQIMDLCKRLNTDVVSLLAAPTLLDGTGPAELLATSFHERTTRANPSRKEPLTADWIAGLDADGVFYDIGANVGSYALLAAARGLTVFAFEPGFAAYAALCRNAAHNKSLPGQITPLPILLWAKLEIVPFRYRTFMPSDSSHTVPATSSIREADGFEQRQIGIPLDNLLDWGLPPPNHIKIDVDGGEEAVLRGAYRTLRHPGLQSVLIETGLAEGGIAELLYSANFKQDRQSPLRKYNVSETVFVRDRS